MNQYQTKRRVAHSAENMFALVADVESYPQFLPLCDELHVIGRRREGDIEIIDADMTVAYKFIRETFRSRVSVDATAHQITVEYLNGPFSHLDNRWSFHPAGDQACDVDFYISYAFRSRALQMLMGAMFDRAFRKFAESFEARADSVYGRPTEQKLATI